jgi:hypothetical protein
MDVDNVDRLTDNSWVDAERIDISYFNNDILKLKMKNK